MFDGAMGLPKRAIADMKKGALNMRMDPDKIDFHGKKFDLLNNQKKQKYDWSQDKIDLAQAGDDDTRGMAYKMQNLEKSFKADFAIRNNKDKKVYVPVVEPENEQDDPKRFNRNVRLMTPSMLALRDKRTAGVMLKEELKESNLRLKAVK